MPEVLIPEPGLYVHTVASPEHPGGDVVYLPPGFQELPPELQSHAILSHLVPSSDEGKALLKHQHDVFEQEQERRHLTEEALVEYYAKATDLDNQSIEALRVAEEERGNRINEALIKGEPREEPAVDPAVIQAIAITMSPNQHMMVSSAGMASKVDPPYPPGAGAGAGGEAPATAPPVNRDVPHVTGDGTVGSTLNCTKGNWDNMGGEGQVSGTYAYAWQTDGTPNSATGENYNVVAGDVGKSISCIVTGTNSLGSVAAPVSNAVTITEGNGARTARRTTV